eukprot:SAG31_NODE_10526_length_1128_cov_1.556851_2_plen_148_part_00
MQGAAVERPKHSCSSSSARCLSWRSGARAHSLSLCPCHRHIGLTLQLLGCSILKRAKYSGRSDDNIESLRKRFQTYKNETMPIVQVFRERGACIEVDTSQPRPEVYALVKNSLSAFTDATLAEEPLTERAEMLLGLRPFPKKKPKKL